MAGIRREATKANRQSPLYFLENSTVGAIKAANKILDTPDLIISVARQYGEKSPEFEMLRQVWVSRLFQRSIGKTAAMHGELSTKISTRSAAAGHAGRDA